MGSKFRSPLPELKATEMMGVLKPGENVLANITEAAQQKVDKFKEAHAGAGKRGVYVTSQKKDELLSIV